MRAKHFEALREQMVADIAAGTASMSARIGKAVLDERVMQAMTKIPRHEFVPFELQPYAYANNSPVSFSDPSGLRSCGPDGAWCGQQRETDQREGGGVNCSSSTRITPGLLQGTALKRARSPGPCMFQ